MSGRSVLKNAFTVGAFTALSRVLGLVREMLQSRLIGAGIAQSAFTLAFAVPNMARKLFGEGALTAAFVPIFKNELENNSLEAAAKLARAVITTVMLMLTAIVGIGLLSIESFVSIRESLGCPTSERMQLIVSLVTILLPYMVFICAAAFGMGVLNAFGRFKASSFMPCLLNLCWIGILVAIWFTPSMDVVLRIKLVAYAILIAGVLQMAFMFWQMTKVGVAPLPSFKMWRDPKFKLVWQNVAIGAVGAGAVQINYLLDQVLAQLASPWAAGVIGYAERLMDLPLGIIGVTFGTVLLPTLSGYFAKGDCDGARSTLVSSLVSLQFVMIPSAVGLAILAPEITRVIYEGGAFDALATTRVSRAVSVYSIGLAFFGFQKVLVPWFHAQSDMKTPLHVSLFTVVLNAVVNILAVWLLPVEWRHVGLAASTVFCAGVGCLMLLSLATRKNGSLGILTAAGSLSKIVIVSLIMGAAIWFIKPFAATYAQLISTHFTSLTELIILMLCGIIVYFSLARLAILYH